MVRICLKEIDDFCDFGSSKEYIISPSFVQSPYSSSNPPEIETRSHLEKRNSFSSPRPKSIDYSFNSESSHPMLQRSLSEQCSSTLSHARRRQSSDYMEEDEHLIVNSPPPNLTEYQLQENSEEPVVEEPLKETNPKSNEKSISKFL